MNFKSFLDQNQDFTTVFHVSPRSDMKILRPISHKRGTRALIGKGQPGLFVAPKFRDAVAWATSYVGGKKYYTQRPNERLKELGKGWHGEKGIRSYKNLTIYEIKVPKEVLKKSTFTGWWEPEFFISAEHIPDMSIVKSRTYSLDELSRIYTRNLTTRSQFRPSEDKTIEELSKTNLAARYYLELTDLYNEALMKGKKPVLITKDFPHRSEHLVNAEIQKLKRFMYKESLNSFHQEPVIKLNRVQENEVNLIYDKVSRLIQNLA
jgi:hypothetical protein